MCSTRLRADFCCLAIAAFRLWSDLLLSPIQAGFDDPAVVAVADAAIAVTLTFSLFSGEIDSFMGELNFCLGPSDSVLSGPSLLKDLNTATNKIVKNLLILNSPGQSAQVSQPVARSVRPTSKDSGTASVVRRTLFGLFCSQR